MFIVKRLPRYDRAPDDILQIEKVLIWGSVPLDNIFVFSVSVLEPAKSRINKKNMKNSILDLEHFRRSDIFNR